MAWNQLSLIWLFFKKSSTCPGTGGGKLNCPLKIQNSFVLSKLSNPTTKSGDFSKIRAESYFSLCTQIALPSLHNFCVWHLHTVVAKHIKNLFHIWKYSFTTTGDIGIQSHFSKMESQVLLPQIFNIQLERKFLNSYLETSGHNNRQIDGWTETNK